MITTTVRPERVFRALSDPTRLRILHLLAHGEVCVCDIVSALDVPQPTASRHLAYLRRAGLVSARKEGVWAHYSLTAADDDFARRVRDCLACCADRPQFRRDAARLGKCRSDCC